VQQIDQALTVIVISGYATVESAVEAMKKGAYDFISKPFTPDQLRIVVRRAITKRALEEEARMLREEREKSLRDIATEKSKLRVIVNALVDGVLVVNRDNHIVLNNPAATKMLGIEMESIVNKPLQDCIRDKNLYVLPQMVSDLQTRKLSAICQEMEIQGDYGLHLRIHACQVKGEDDDILGTVFVLQDISYIKELDRMKSDFIAMVSHELKAPLTAIQQQILIMAEGLLGATTEKQTEVLLRIKVRTNNLLTLIKNLLDLSCIEAGKIVQCKEPLQLNDIAEKVTELLDMQADKKNISLKLKKAKNLPIIDADPNNMEEIFTNLVSNAIHYTPGGGEVVIKTGRQGEYVKIEVSDTGIGIKEEDLPRIFDKFYRVQSDQTRMVAGSGLGLSIVKGIVEAHLGKIDVVSQVGKGTTFKVLLPQKSNTEISPVHSV
jgi:two-component system phosphate regulon sensor histidine kinase PhoR